MAIAEVLINWDGWVGTEMNWARGVSANSGKAHDMESDLFLLLLSLAEAPIRGAKLLILSFMHDRSVVLCAKCASKDCVTITDNV